MLSVMLLKPRKQDSLYVITVIHNKANIELNRNKN